MSGPNGRRGRIVVMGIVGLSPYAGVAWQALHYLVGLRQLGYDVHYAEDTQAWTYDADQETFTADARFTLSYLDRVMAWGGLGDRWAFRAAPPNDRLFGPAAPRFFQVLRDADALINLTGSTILRSEYLRVPVRIYLETDPVWPQVAVARGHLTEFMDAHTHHFTFGENIGGSDCGVPVGRYVYRATRQPVVLSWWAPGGVHHGRQLVSDGQGPRLAGRALHLEQAPRVPQVPGPPRSHQDAAGASAVGL